MDSRIAIPQPRRSDTADTMKGYSMRTIVTLALLISATACGRAASSQPAPPTAAPGNAAVLGPPPAGAGTITDAGEIQPADPSKFNVAQRDERAEEASE
jgi:hypothetical protein